MEILADLHVHSHFSVATGREADLEHLDLWGRYKGLQVVGTGDCTHPQWLAEMEAKLTPLAAGLYGLKRDLALPLNMRGPAWEAAPPVHFLITGEVSTIYKKAGKVRKVHLLLLLPHLTAARELSRRLSRIGNVASDGRPILGLDAKLLLELVLTVDPAALVIPAHIWTPWFSVLGSKSGFDSLEECFEEATEHIYALETGLSSDPAMNWRVSGLDRYVLVSNSDAHSPQKLAREANIFHVPLSYPDLTRALRTREGFGGTLEFFPEEGKYHLDGHRQCALRLTPDESAALGDICPHCGKPLTLGVVHRVQDLADREIGSRPPAASPFTSLIALPMVLAEVLGVNSPAGKKVQQRYFQLLEKLGPELRILRQASLEELARAGGEDGAEIGGLLAHGLDKMRRGEVHINGGYDGAYGEIRLFTPQERQTFRRQGAFFAPPPAKTAPPSDLNFKGATSTAPLTAAEPAAENRKPETGNLYVSGPLLQDLNAAQREAVTHQGPPLIVQAGPGTGKTRALTHRLAYLLSRRGAAPEAVLALTFTRQAAAEMESRIFGLLPDFPNLSRLTVQTFHSLGHGILQDYAGSVRQVADEEVRRSLIREIARERGLSFAGLERRLSHWKQALLYPPLPDLDAQEVPWHRAFQAYEAALAARGLWDYEDLIARPALLLAAQPDLREAYRRRGRHLLVDEFQDLNEAQYQLFRSLAGPETEIMVIGDPDQAIYGFRGASPAYFSRFLADWPGARLCRFTETYRLPLTILEAAGPLRDPGGEFAPPLVTHQLGNRPVVLLEAADPTGEARLIAREIEKLMGGFSHLGMESRQVRQENPSETAGFRDIAVLYRFHALGAELARVLGEAGIPCEQPREGVGPEWDGLDLAAERVKLLTLHAAKGLEFPYVFIAGCESGLIPWEPEGDNIADADEERRLFYVGLTRASRQVFLSRARQRSLWGRRRRAPLSPWVKSMPAATLLRPAAPDTPRRRGRQPSLFGEEPSRSKKLF